MANHCFNSISITGPILDVRAFMVAASNNETGMCLDFNTVVPVPKKLCEPNSSSPNGENKNEQNQSDQTDSTSFSDWIEKNWGSKWIKCDDEGWEEYESKNGDSLSISVSAETAWSPPTEFFLNASKKFPTLTFFNEFNEPGAEFIGDHVIKNGCWVRRVEPDWDSEEGIEMRKEQGVLCDEDGSDDIN